MKNIMFNMGCIVAVAGATLATPAYAAPGDPVVIGQGLTFDPIIDARLRWEHVDQPTTDADAVTARIRSGFEVKHKSGFAFLAEAEGTVAIDGDYRAAPFFAANGRSVVADPENIELNRLQLQYKTKSFGITVGRQRLNLDDQRFVGSVGWRQNEQTFDAVRAEGSLGPVAIDAIYSNSQRTIFGIDAGPRQAYGGDLIFLGATVKNKILAVKGFAYILDYDEAFFAAANSSQTYGGRATGSLPLSKTVKLDFALSYANQTNIGLNTRNYTADYVAAEGNLSIKKFKLTAGYELLASDGRANFAFQTPAATGHKFNGWADLFLTTPTTGLQDYYGGIGWTGPKIGKAGPIVATFVFHSFHSDRNSIHYGDEYDAQVGMKLTKQLSALIKYADYERKGIASFAGDQDTKRFWLEFDYSL